MFVKSKTRVISEIYGINEALVRLILGRVT